MSVEQSKSEWCPTMAGHYVAYAPEFFGDGEWRRITLERSKHGVPQPLWMGGLNDTLCLCGYEQANALAWLFKAAAESEGKSVQVRVVAFDVVYDLKARQIEGDKMKDLVQQEPTP